MPWFTRIFFASACSLLAVVCAVVFSALVLGLPDGYFLAVFNPFIMLALGEFACRSLWPWCLLFGVWATFLPPRGGWAFAVYCLAAVAVGVRTSRTYQLFEWPEYPFEAGMEHVTPTFHLASLTTVASCATALASALACAFMGHHLLRAQRPNHALQRTGSACG